MQGSAWWLAFLVAVGAPTIAWLSVRTCLDLDAYPSVDRSVAVAAALTVGPGASLAVSVIGSVGDALAVAFSLAILWAIAVCDLLTRRVPNVLVGILACIGLAYSVSQRVELLPILAGAAIVGLLFLLIRVVKRGAMGMGDVKLAAALGLLLGLRLSIQGLALGIVAGGVGAVLMLITGSAKRRDSMAYAPYLAAGGWIVLASRCGLFG